MKKAEFKKYRRRPVVIEAIQWVVTHTPSDDAKPIVDLIKSLGGDAYFVYDYNDNMTYHPKIIITTLEGTMSANPGDFICRGLNGEFWPQNPNNFNRTNEPVEPSTDLVPVEK